MYYVGGDTVNEDEQKAVYLFAAAAGQRHAAAMYMLGDCLLEGTVLGVDRAAALRWLVAAGDEGKYFYVMLLRSLLPTALGHRGARSRVFALTDPTLQTRDDRFTDASRQSLRPANV